VLLKIAVPFLDQLYCWLSEGNLAICEDKFFIEEKSDSSNIMDVSIIRCLRPLIL
jgi:hypothetical protein